MNHIYRIIWNETLGAWVAVAENVKRKGKKSTKLAVGGALILSSQLAIAGYDVKCNPSAQCVSTEKNFTQTITLKSRGCFR